MRSFDPYLTPDKAASLIFDADGSYVPPSDALSLDVEGWGGQPLYLSGTTYLGGTVAAGVRVVAVTASRPGGSRQWLGQTLSDENGHYSLTLTTTEPVWLIAHLPESTNDKPLVLGPLYAAAEEPTP